MLLRVWFKGRQRMPAFIHIEVQGFYEKEFLRRMFDDKMPVCKLYNR